MTIYDIAREAGVAASTVSRVINNKPGIKAETRERIQALLRKYNYTPDAAARGLVKQSTRMIGILIVDIRVPHHIDSAFVIEQEMVKKGYCCIIMSTGPTDEKKVEYIRLLGQRRVEGVILMSSMFMTDRVKEAIQQNLPGIPVVMVNGDMDLPNVSGVVVDEDIGVEQCVDLLVSKGKRRIAFVRDGHSPSVERKQAGYHAGMRKLGLSEEDLWVYQALEGTLSVGYEMTVDILREHPDAQGIIYAVDILAAGGVRAAQDLGYRVPEDLGLIGIDNCIYGEICMPKLTTLDNKMEELSNTAVAILQENLEGRMQKRKVLLQSEIVERETT